MKNETTTLFSKVMERFMLFNKIFGIVKDATRHIPRVNTECHQTLLHKQLLRGVLPKRHS